MPRCDVCVTFNNNKPIMNIKTRLEQEPRNVTTDLNKKVRDINHCPRPWFYDSPELSSLIF